MRHATTVSGSRGYAVVAVALTLGVGRSAPAQTLVVSGSPAPMRVSSAVAGGIPDAVTDASTSYTFNSPGPKKKITAQLSAPMPTGVTLQVTLDPQSGAVSIPNVSLDATARDVVTGIQAKQSTPLNITYTLTATLAAGVVPVQSRTVTLTITSAP
jgi:hypothetical protein